MKKTRYVALVLLSSLLTLVGCSRREILDDYPVTGINIRLDWEGVTGRLPEGVRVIFYPKDTQGRKIDTYLPAKGGEMKVPPGHYLAVIYNYDTRSSASKRRRQLRNDNGVYRKLHGIGRQRNRKHGMGTG